MHALSEKVKSCPLVVEETVGKYARLTVTKDGTRLKVPKSYGEAKQLSLVKIGKRIDRHLRERKHLTQSYRGKFLVRSALSVFVIMTTGRRRGSHNGIAFQNGLPIAKRKQPRQ